MKAVVYEKYGSPDVLELKEIEKPSVTSDEILVKIHAASVQPMDIRFRTGTPLLARAIAGLTKPKSKILGFDCSGTVESVGENITGYSPGDEVIGLINSDNKGGTHAEYISFTKEEFARKPHNLTHVQAATAGMAGLMALQGVRDHGEVKPGKKFLINGASGGIGTFAVQMAKHYGAEVTGVCSTVNLEMVRSLGADHVIDYTKEDFTQSGEPYDVIFDAVAKISSSRGKKFLKKTGIYLNIITSSDDIKVKTEDLIFLKELIEAGKIKSVIDRRYPLEQTAEAHRYVDKGHKKGNVVITLEHNNKT